MVKEDTKTQSVRMWCCLDDLGSQVRNAFDSFVVRAPKITLLATKTVRESSSTYTPSAQDPHISVGGSSLAISSEPSAPCSCATARDQLTNDNKRRLLSLHPLPPIAEEEDPAKIPVRAVILALRRAVSLVEQPQNRESTQETPGQRLRHDSRRLRESRFRRNQDAFLKKAVEQAPGRISGDVFKRRDGAAFVAQRRSNSL